MITPRTISVSYCLSQLLDNEITSTYASPTPHTGDSVGSYFEYRSPSGRLGPTPELGFLRHCCCQTTYSGRSPMLLGFDSKSQDSILNFFRKGRRKHVTFRTLGHVSRQRVLARGCWKMKQHAISTPARGNCCEAWKPPCVRRPRIAEFHNSYSVFLMELNSAWFETV